MHDHQLSKVHLAEDQVDLLDVVLLRDSERPLDHVWSQIELFIGIFVRYGLDFALVRLRIGCEVLVDVFPADSSSLSGVFPLIACIYIVLLIVLMMGHKLLSQGVVPVDARKRLIR